jgi:hypothetical protein
MRNKWVVAALLVIVFLVPAVGLAHDGPHKVIGTVTAVRGNQVEVRTTAGKRETVVLGAATPVTRGTAKASVADVKVGERVSIDCTDQKGVMTAQAVKLGTAAAR